MRFEKKNDCYRDTKTGLEWSKESAPKKLNWDDANAWCQGLGAGWRLPTRTDLLSIIDNSFHNPCTALPGMAGSFSHYWSSSTNAYDTSSMKLVCFYDGYVSDVYKSNNHHARAVRTQQG